MDAPHDPPGGSDRSDSGALRAIPSLDAFLRHDRFARLPRRALLREARRYLDGLRERVRGGALDRIAVEMLFAGPDAADAVVAACRREGALHHCRVVNATGVVLHTGIGRAPLCDAARDAVAQAARHAIVEIDPQTGERNQRECAVAALLAELCAVDAALVVNNNAAAVNLMLRALATGEQVVVSRGEQVEIGGGFRMPDVMREAGCHMVEVGATNRTHLRDFAAALGDGTRMLLKIHTSNFRIVGFTSQPTLAELVGLARGRPGVIVAEDLGSGLLVGEAIAGLEDEPRVADSVAAGAHLVLFSGDKLLGGPQCGILIGDAELVRRCRAHPLYRAFRCDKLTLSALEATLRVYRDGDPLREIPTLRALAAGGDELRARAEALAARLGALQPEVVATDSYAGSGANPARPLPSFGVAVRGGQEVSARLRGGPGAPVIARIEDQRVVLDSRTLLDDDLDDVAALVLAKLTGTGGRNGSHP